MRLVTADKYSESKHKNAIYNNVSYFKGHLEPVKDMAIVIAFSEGMDSTERTLIESIAYLHDVLEDTKTEPEEINELFGFLVYKNVCLLSRAINGYSKSDDEYYKEISSSKYAMIVKAADRIVNINNIPNIKEKNRREKLINKYKDEYKHYEKYGIFPELINLAFKKIKS